MARTVSIGTRSSLLVNFENPDEPSDVHGNVANHGRAVDQMDGSAIVLQCEVGTCKVRGAI